MGSSLFCAGLCYLLGGLDGAGGIRMGGQLVTMGMGMGRMYFWKNGLFDGFVFRMRQRAGCWMMACIFQLAIPVLAGSSLDRDFHIALVFGRGLSW